MRVLRTDGRSGVFHSPWSSSGIHRTRKRALGPLEVRRSLLHLCSQPSVTGSAKSAGSAVTACAYSAVMLLSSLCFI